MQDDTISAVTLLYKFSDFKKLLKFWKSLSERHWPCMICCIRIVCNVTLERLVKLI